MNSLPFGQENVPDSLALIRRTSNVQSQSMSIRPDPGKYSISAPQPYIFTPRQSSALFPHRIQKDSPPAFTMDPVLIRISY